MNIIIINHYAGSDEYGMEFRPLYLGRELVKQGHEVTVLAASYSHLRKKQPTVSHDFEEQTIDGVRYVFVKTPAYSGNTPMRFLNIFCFYQKVLHHAKALAHTYKPDAVVGSSTYPNDVKLAKKIASYTGAKVAYEIHDLWPLSLIELYGFSESNPFIRFLQKAENYAYAQSDVVLSILSNTKEHIHELGYRDVRFVHIPNGVSLSNETVAVPHAVKSAFDTFHANGEFIVLYLGGFATANALETFVESAKQLPNKVRLVLVGDGVLKPKLIDFIASNHLDNVSILDAVPKGAVNGVLSLADCLYIGAKKSNLYRYGIGMNKLFDYMLSAKPIICGIDAADNPIELADCGRVIEPESVPALLEAITALYAMPQNLLCEMGKRGQDYVTRVHNYSLLAEQFADALR